MPWECLSFLVQSPWWYFMAYKASYRRCEMMLFVVQIQMIKMSWVAIGQVREGRKAGKPRLVVHLCNLSHNVCRQAHVLRETELETDSFVGRDSCFASCFFAFVWPPELRFLHLFASLVICKSQFSAEDFSPSYSYTFTFSLSCFIFVFS